MTAFRDEPPSFLDVLSAGHFKGRSGRRVGCAVGAGHANRLLGKAHLGHRGTPHLHKRLDDFRSHGAGIPIGHSGRRRIWQLADGDGMLVAFRAHHRTRRRTDEAAAAHRPMQRRGHRRPARAASADLAATTCAEGVRCHDIIDGERRAHAVRYLAVPGLHLQQIAGLLGYSEQSALNRSCRRWFGQTPRQYRASRSAT
jgi:hypothetical protein